jgi:Chaperone of endosialidase/Secretion system C-terminal sorting domain
MKKLSFVFLFFVAQLGFAQNWNNNLNVLNNNIVNDVYRRGPIGVGFGNYATYTAAVGAGFPSIMGRGGIVSHFVSGSIGDFNNNSKWCGIGLGNPAGPVRPYGFAAIDTAHLAFYNIIRQTATRKDLVAGYGFAEDNRNVNRFRVVHYNLGNIPAGGKNILTANPRGAVGINTEPFAALSVDTRVAAQGGVLPAEPGNNGIIVKAIAIQGEQKVVFPGPVGILAGSASAIGNQANTSLVLSGIAVEGLRAQLPAFDQAANANVSIATDLQSVIDGNGGLSPVVSAIPAPAQYGELTWQDLVFVNNVSTNCAAINSNKNFHISFRNGRTGTVGGVIDPVNGNSFSAANKLPVATFTPRGRVGIGTTNPICQVGATPVFLTVAGAIWANGILYPSDSRFKKDIKTIENALDKIRALRGTTYTYDKDKLPYKNFKDGTAYGFIAQEVEKVIPEMTALGDDGYYAVDYVTLIPILTEAIKEQDQIVTDLQSEVAQLKSDMAALRNTRAESAGYKLYQNVPNPTNGKTSIAYEITQPYNSASVNVYDLNGRYVQGFDIKDTKGTVTLSLENLTPGMYIYDLMIDGEQKAVKKLSLISRS